MGGTVKVCDSEWGLGFDFGFQIFDTELEQESVRLIKVQCPGVEHSDIEVRLLFNGCEPTVWRKASRGVQATKWSRRFQFRPSDGLFEFREELMRLEKGYLQLVFRTYSFQSRVIRFPQHFSLADSDTDHNWEYPADNAVSCEQVTCDKDGRLFHGGTLAGKFLQHGDPDDGVSTASTPSVSR